ncbi:nitrile hydratase subunit beta [Metapseudomonas lalkuanensis]|uniref:nitrile hydratase n=1 Tax=Metapseudomonas lalkuanensis TaxID=2604832 RepID=A0A5J6QKJ6_9GAMM|nr:nitrile hydratase subunit beta [Pseudomonas lalkuanensis]QEY63034.1 nitrile hydratase subunit beta [Pseudomonas lalkuanensis]
MKLQHYLGGLENLGPVDFEKRVFVQEWEKRIFGIHTTMMAESAHLIDSLPRYPMDTLPTSFKSDWTWASLRTGAEGMQPFEYFKFRYYEKWLGGISSFFINQGYISEEEFKSRADFYRKEPDAPLPDKPSAPIREQIVRYLEQGDSGMRPCAGKPLFAAGDSVTVADPAAVDHTRLPGYLRSKPGKIVEVYPGAFAYFVNTGLDGIGKPMPVYRVAFDAADIWGVEKSEPNTMIYADLFEAYVQAPV